MIGGEQFVGQLLEDLDKSGPSPWLGVKNMIVDRGSSFH